MKRSLIINRSTGYGSLSVWIKHLRTGIQFQEAYNQGDCFGSSWKGSVFTIGGGYIWADVYAEAMARNRVVVGGGTPVSLNYGPDFKLNLCLCGYYALVLQIWFVKEKEN